MNKALDVFIWIAGAVALFLALGGMSGCATGPEVSAGLAQAADFRKSAAAIRHSAFCNQSAAAALERYRSPEDRQAFLKLCDGPAAQ